MHIRSSWHCVHRPSAETADDLSEQEVRKHKQAALQQQLSGLRVRMEAAVQLNSSLEAPLQLSSHELLLNTALRYGHHLDVWFSELCTALAKGVPWVNAQCTVKKCLAVMPCLQQWDLLWHSIVQVQASICCSPRQHTAFIQGRNYLARPQLLCDACISKLDCSQPSSALWIIARMHDDLQCCCDGGLSCREKLLKQGRCNINAVREGIQRQQKINTIKAKQLREACWDSMAVPESRLLPVGHTSLLTGLAEYEPSQEMTARFATCHIAPVRNMPIRKLSHADAKQLQQVCCSLSGHHSARVSSVPALDCSVAVMACSCITACHDKNRGHPDYVSSWCRQKHVSRGNKQCLTWIIITQ